MSEIVAVFGKTTLTLAFVATLLSACVDPEIAALCRAHSDNVLVFRWSGGREVLPVDPRILPEEGELWRQQLGFPERPDPERRYPGRRVSAVEPFADGWLVGTDSGEWGGALYYVRKASCRSRWTWEMCVL